MVTPAALQAELVTAERRRSAVDEVTTIHFDELDPFHMLHNTRYAVFVERATAAFFEHVGRIWELEVERNPDLVSWTDWFFDRRTERCYSRTAPSRDPVARPADCGGLVRAG